MYAIRHKLTKAWLWGKMDASSANQSLNCIKTFDVKAQALAEFKNRKCNPDFYEIVELKIEGEDEGNMIYITPAEFEDQMNKIYRSDDGDTEMNHIKADELMCEVLRQNGYDKGVLIFEDQLKWYA